MSENVRIYMDNAAATAADTRVVAAMQPFWTNQVGNPGALHKEGVQAQEAVNTAQGDVARVLCAQPHEIIFTSGGTEANSLGILGVVRALKKNGRKAKEMHVVVGAIEHSSISGCISELSLEGVHTTTVSVDAFGHVDLGELKAALQPQTVLVSVMYVNNEIGTVEHIHKIAQLVRATRKQNNSPFPLLHSDACQAPAWLPVNVKKLGVDLLSLNGQKIFGPKGVGCLYAGSHVPLASILCSSSGSVRPGTAPVPLIVGFAKALSLVEEERASYVTSISELRDYLISEIQDSVGDAVLNGPLGEERLANNVNFSFPGIDGEQMVIELDARGIAASSRSACLRDSEKGSYVVQALGGAANVATSAVRLTLSRHTTKKEVEYVARTIVEAVNWLRKSTGIDKTNML